jgi:predicted esterase
MKYKSILLLFSVFLFSNCSNKGKENSSSQSTTTKVDSTVTAYKPGIIVSAISCSKNPAVEYALYLPKNYDKYKKYPVIFFFDAHARGSQPLKMYSQIADAYEFIFVGSNNSKNGLDNQTLTEIISATMNDALVKFSINPKQIYTSGFSGGAKVASIAAFGSPQVKGVIACSAAMPVELLSRPLTFDYIGIAGLEDFNYKEMAAQERELKNMKHELFVFKGKHEWAPANVMDKAIRKIISNSMEEGRRTKDENFISATNLLLKDSLIHTNYSVAQQEQEEKLQEQYMQALTEKDNIWWTKEMEKANKEMGDKGLIYKRAQAYASMACYTYIVKALSQNRPEIADHYVTIYKMVDPKNADAYYFNAMLLAMQHKNPEALEALKKSAELGLDDVEKLRNEIAFKGISNSEAFEDVLAKVSENSSN